MVEIEIQQGVATDAQSGGAQPVRQLGFEFTPVRQIGQLVMTGLMDELLRQQTRVREIAQDADATDRSEEHTSELQSLMRISYAVFCLKKKNKKRHAKRKTDLKSNKKYTHI